MSFLQMQEISAKMYILHFMKGCLPVFFRPYAALCEWFQVQGQNRHLKAYDYEEGYWKDS